jgi:DNA-binding transcriptional ArsR family regulator
MKKTIADPELMTAKLRAFGSIPRLKLMMCLGESPKNVSQLIGNCGLTQSAVSQHLAKLKAAGLLQCDCKGRERIYSLLDPRSAEISRNLYKLLEK